MRKIKNPILNQNKYPGNRYENYYYSSLYYLGWYYFTGRLKNRRYHIRNPRVFIEGWGIRNDTL